MLYVALNTFVVVHLSKLTRLVANWAPGFFKSNTTSTYFLRFFLLSCRFLRHVPVIYVDYPGPHSLNQIYGTFNRAMLRLVPNLRAYSDPLTEAMVEFYTKSQVKDECNKSISFYLYCRNISLKICSHITFTVLEK